MNIVLDDGLSLNISKIENLWSRMNFYGCNIDICYYANLYTNNTPIYFYYAYGFILIHFKQFRHKSKTSNNLLLLERSTRVNRTFSVSSTMMIQVQLDLGRARLGYPGDWMIPPDPRRNSGPQPIVDGPK